MRPRNPAVEYGLAVAAVAIAWLLRQQVDPWLGNALPFLTLYFSVILAAWYGGLGPGLLATGLGFLVGEYFFAAPRHSLMPSTLLEGLDATRYVLVGIAISAFTGQLRAAQRRASDETQRALAQQRELEREVRERRAAEREAHGQRERLRVIVSSIGDGVITTDTETRVVLMNGVAETLTGWSAADAAGQPLETVFRIVNESTRVVVANPAARALHEGVIVGLANHTVLIAKNGVERPIDDSAAPIRNDEGTITGAVLVFRDVGERRFQENRLLEADRRKSEFLAILAHELRNPLAATVNSLEILKRADHDSSAAAIARATMERQLGQLVRLVDDLMDLNRVSRGKFELRRQPLELSAVLDQALEACRPAVGVAHHAIEVKLPAEPIVVDCDPVRLTQVFSNLIGNACKFSGTGSRVEIAATREGEWAIVSIRDHGIGFTRETGTRLFEMFVQADRALEQTDSGLGIGLSLVKQLVEMHGGSVAGQSDGLGRGSTFTVRLPAAVSAVRPLAPRAKATAVNSAARRVLIADDNQDSATSLAMLLRMAGHETHVANDGAEALEIAAAVKPDVILLDIGMPRVNGYEVARRIRGERWGRHTTLIAVTGWGQADDRERSRQAGFDDHLVKPVDHRRLVERLASAPAPPPVGA